MSGILESQTGWADINLASGSVRSLSNSAPLQAAQNEKLGEPKSEEDSLLIVLRRDPLRLLLNPSSVQTLHLPTGFPFS